MTTPADRPTPVRHYVLAALLVITAINYIQRNAINPAATTIQADLGLDRILIGQVLGAFFLSYTLMMVPSGIVAQFLGSKWALVLFASTWSLALAATALADGFYGLYAGRIAIGILQAGIFPCATLILQAWYPASRRGLATALLNSFMVIGGAVGTFLTGQLLEPLGWRGVFVAFAVPGLLWALWFAWWFRSRPEDHPGVNPAELDVIRDHKPLPEAVTPRTTPAASEAVKAHHDAVTDAPPSPPPAPPSKPRLQWSMLTAAVIFSLFLLYLQQGFRAGANRLFDTWMPTYYETARGLTRPAAANLTAILQIALVVGGMAGGMLSDYVLTRTGSKRAARTGVAIFSLIGSSLLYVAAYPIENVYLATLVFGTGAFLFCFSSPCAYSLTIDMGGKYLAIVFSLMNMFGNLGAWAFVSFLPYLERAGGWDLALGVFVGMHLAAAVCWFLLDPEIVVGEPRLPLAPLSPVSGERGRG